MCIRDRYYCGQTKNHRRIGGDFSRNGGPNRDRTDDLTDAKDVYKRQLHTYLADLNEQATERCSLIIEQMAEAEGVDEAMKAENQMLWVQSMNLSLIHISTSMVSRHLV